MNLALEKFRAEALYVGSLELDCLEVFVVLYNHSHSGGETHFVMKDSENHSENTSLIIAVIHNTYIKAQISVIHFNLKLRELQTFV